MRWIPPVGRGIGWWRTWEDGAWVFGMSAYAAASTPECREALSMLEAETPDAGLDIYHQDHAREDMSGGWHPKRVEVYL